MINKKAVGIRLNENVYDKLQTIADRYGMTVNSLMAYILGQWADSNFDMKDKLADKVIEQMANKSMDIENNPVAKKMVEEMMAEFLKGMKDSEE